MVCPLSNSTTAKAWCFRPESEKSIIAPSASVPAEVPWGRSSGLGRNTSEIRKRTLAPLSVGHLLIPDLLFDAPLAGILASCNPETASRSGWKWLADKESSFLRNARFVRSYITLATRSCAEERAFFMHGEASMSANPGGGELPE